MKLITLFTPLVLLLSCTYDPTAVNKQENTALAVTIILNDAPSRNSRATVVETLHLRLSQSDASLLIDTSLALTDDIGQLLLEDIPAGENYLLSLWTTNSEGDTVHTPADETISIVADQLTQVAVTLQPRLGSILAQLYALGTDIDSVALAFEADSGAYSVIKKRSSSLFLSLDNIPYNASGTIKISALSDTKDTLLSWDTLFTFTGFQSIEISFAEDGSLIADITVIPSPTSIFSGSGSPSSSLLDEVGRGIVISEFCATAGSAGTSRDFVELLNAADSSVSYSALELIVGSYRITLPPLTLAPQERYTVGSALAHEVWSVDTIATLDITATSDQLYLYSGDTLVDYVIYFNDEETGWPKLSSSAKTSWECTNLIGDPEANNFPIAWRAATSEASLFDGDSWIGTPGN